MSNFIIIKNHALPVTLPEIGNARPNPEYPLDTANPHVVTICWDESGAIAMPDTLKNYIQECETRLVNDNYSHAVSGFVDDNYVPDPNRKVHKYTTVFTHQLD